MNFLITNQLRKIKKLSQKGFFVWNAQEVKKP
jgi:hypothetical protein